VLVADLVPKLLARRVRVGAARVLARPLGIVLGVVGPACGFLETWVVMPLVRLVRSDHGAPQLDVDELASVLELSARSGEIRADEQRALGDIIELGQLRVRDVMTPRVSMLWIDAAAGVDAARVEVMRARRERLPVFAGGKSGMDEPPIGFLNVRRFVQMLAAAGPDARRSDAALRASLDPVTFVPERARLDRAFDLFRARRTTSAMVVDEFGGVVGIVAMSDLVRQMVAPARRAELLAESATGLTPVVRVRADAWSVSGRLPLRALREFLFAGAGGADGGGASTIAGLVMQRLGRVPRVGDEVEVGGLRARVTEMGERVIERVEISVPPGRVEARS
jgi:CBS domain containing-hemolysin-like protein